MTDARLYITEPCPCCGHQRKVVNGRALRERRERAGLTQRDFGAFVGVTSPYLSDIERNRRACPADILRAYQKLEAR